MQVDKFPETFVESDQDTVFGPSSFQKGSIPGIGTKIVGIQYVVSVVEKPIRQPPASASVHHKPHRPCTETASRDSPAMTEWA